MKPSPNIGVALVRFFLGLGSSAVESILILVVLVVAAAMLGYAIWRASKLKERAANREDHERLAEDCKRQAEVHRELADKVEAEDSERAERLRSVARHQDRLAAIHQQKARR